MTAMMRMTRCKVIRQTYNLSLFVTVPLVIPGINHHTPCRPVLLDIHPVILEVLPVRDHLLEKPAAQSTMANADEVSTVMSSQVVQRPLVRRQEVMFDPPRIRPDLRMASKHRLINVPPSPQTIRHRRVAPRRINVHLHNTQWEAHLHPREASTLQERDRKSVV